MLISHCLRLISALRDKLAWLSGGGDRLIAEGRSAKGGAMVILVLLESTAFVIAICVYLRKSAAKEFI